MKRRRKITLPNGDTAYELIDLRKKCCLNYLKYTNETHSCGIHGLPELVSNTDVYPDYIALYGQPSLYHHTSLTAVGFWQYDNVFDGIHGLYSAIYYGDEELLEQHRQRFEGVRIFFTPDYSQFGDVDDLEEHYRLKKARIVGLWFAKELGAVVIPFITMPTADSVGFALDGLEKCSVVAFSTKGCVDDDVERDMLKEIVKRTVDILSLKAIIVYDVCGDMAAVEDIFSYAISEGIEIVVPRNSLKDRNTARKEEIHAQNQ